MRSPNTQIAQSGAGIAAGISLPPLRLPHGDYACPPTRRRRAHGRSPLAAATACLFLLQWLAFGPGPALAQSPTFGANAQHSGNYSVPAQPLNAVHWSTNIDLYSAGDCAHYGAPLITPANTLIVPLRTNASNWMLNVFAAATGRRKYTLATDYLMPPYGWLPVYQAVLATNSSGTRLYYAGAGGTVYYLDNPDADTPGTPVQLCFYTSLAAYQTNAAVLNSNVFINTGLTADTNGAVFFGFRLLTNGAPTATTDILGGYARIAPDGTANYVLATTAINPGAGSTAATPPHNSVPALSLDGSTLYAAVKSLAPNGTNFLLGLDSRTLATKYSTPLISPVQPIALVIDSDSTASPTVGPDGDVFFGVVDSDDRGYLLHFSADLRVTKTPSGFGWDSTASIVPTNMVPGYTGPSSYLLLCKYNNYVGRADGDGVNRIALLDPNATQLDFHPTESKFVDMRIVRSVIGCTPDNEYLSSVNPHAVREWCVNTVAVNPATMSVFTASEDGRLYRWNLASNALTESVPLGAALGEPYVPITIGPDGVVYALNGGRMLAVGGLTNVAVSLASSLPDMRSCLTGQVITFTATVTNPTAGGTLPTGTVKFTRFTYNVLTLITNVLASAVPLTNGVASFQTSALMASSNFLGSHFITAFYSGDANFPAGSATMVQKIHAYATTTRLGMSKLPGGTSMVLTATVTSTAPTGVPPTGMLAFWDGPTFLRQLPLPTNGIVSITNSIPTAGNHLFEAIYESDTLFASSTGTLAPPAPTLIPVPQLFSPGFKLVFSNLYGGSFTVLGSTNPLLPLSNWWVLGSASNTFPGIFQFTDLAGTNPPGRYYRVRNP